MEGHRLRVATAFVCIGLAMLGVIVRALSTPSPEMMQLLEIGSVLFLLIGGILFLLEARAYLKTGGLWHRARDFFASWEWHPFPIRRKSQPPKASLSARVIHVRTHAHFDQFEQGHLLKLCLVFLNASTEEITLESVAGHLSYGGEGGAMELAPVAWRDSHNPPSAKAFDTLDINIQQNIPASAIPLLLERARDGNSLQVEFHLRLKAKVTTSGEIIELHHWRGVLCQIPSLPVVVGGPLIVTFSRAYADAGQTKQVT
jgi:hypothetical protein